MWFYVKGDEGVQGSGNCYCIPKSMSGGLRVYKYQHCGLSTTSKL